MNWYEERIEEPVRDLVRLLRNNGFNTECSCGHEMYVQIAYCDGDADRLDQFLFNHGFRNYTIMVRIVREEGHIRTSMDLRLDKPASGS